MKSERNLVLTGFMGTGKTVVGRILAETLGRPFFDLDEKIESLLGMSVAAIFEKKGEATFRKLERQLCIDLSRPQGLVIATGGGTVLDRENLEKLTGGGLVIKLEASQEALLGRLLGGSSRPLLPDSPQHRSSAIVKLLAARAPAYSRIPISLNTTRLLPEESACRLKTLMSIDREAPDAVATTWQEGTRLIPFLLGEGLFRSLGKLLLTLGPARRVAVVTQAEVEAPHADPVMESLLASGFCPQIFLIPSGEQNKNLSTISDLYGSFVEAGIERGDLVLALGGGVVGDVAGFAAATYMRGLDLVQAPTSLLAMVDSSIGGKTGVDLPQGKNLAGAFKQPLLVIADDSALDTLPVQEYRCGMAEAIKHAILGDPDLFDELGACSLREIPKGLARAVRVKTEVVRGDLYEKGRRAHLNLGHTFGHALEVVSAWKVKHGEAVAIGLVASCHLSSALGLAKKDLARDVEALLRRHGLRTRCDRIPVDVLMRAMSRDKKRHHGKSACVVPLAIGRVQVVSDPSTAAVRRAWLKVGATLG